MRIPLITPLVRQEAYRATTPVPDFEVLRLISLAELLTVAAVLRRLVIRWPLLTWASCCRPRRGGFG